MVKNEQNNVVCGGRKRTRERGWVVSDVDRMVDGSQLRELKQ